MRDLSHRASRVRVVAADALGHLDIAADPALADRVCKALRGALRDDDPEVRYAAALSLGELRDGGAVDPLVDQMEGDGHPLARQAAVIALGLIRDPRALPALLRALHATAPDVRFQAVTSLGQLDADAAAAPLKESLRDEDAEVRGAAAAALGDLGDRSAAPAVARLLADPHPAVRFDAAAALARLGDRRGTAILVEDLDNAERQLAASEHLYRCPDPTAATALRRLLGRWLTPAPAKVWMAAALARLGEPAGREKLVALVDSRRREVRGLSIQLLGEIAEPWALERLQQFAGTPAAAAWQEELAEALHPSPGES